MTLSFEINEQEYREAIAAIRRQPGGDWYKPLRWAGIAGGAIGIAMSLGGGWPTLLMVSPLLFLSLFVVGYPLALMRDHVDSAWDDFKKASGPVTWEFTAEAASFRDDLLSVRYEWRALVRFTETPNLFLLYQSSEQPLLIAKRAIASQEDVAALRALLQTRIAGRALGFPVNVQSKVPGAGEP